MIHLYGEIGAPDEARTGRLTLPSEYITLVQNFIHSRNGTIYEFLYGEPGLPFNSEFLEDVQNKVIPDSLTESIDDLK